MYKTYVSTGEVNKKKLTTGQTKKVVGQFKHEGTKLDTELKTLSKEYRFKLGTLDEEQLKMRQQAEELRGGAHALPGGHEAAVARGRRRNSLNVNLNGTRRRNSLDVRSHVPSSSADQSSEAEGIPKSGNTNNNKETGDNFDILILKDTGNIRDAERSRSEEPVFAARGRRMSMPVIPMTPSSSSSAHGSSGNSLKLKPGKTNHSGSPFLATILDNEEEMNSLTAKDGRRGRRMSIGIGKSHANETLNLSRDLEAFREFHAAKNGRLGRRHSVAVLPSFGSQPIKEEKDIFKEVRNCRYLRIPGRVESDELDLDEIFGKKQKE